FFRQEAREHDAQRADLLAERLVFEPRLGREARHHLFDLLLEMRTAATRPDGPMRQFDRRASLRAAFLGAEMSPAEGLAVHRPGPATGLRATSSLLHMVTPYSRSQSVK